MVKHDLNPLAQRTQRILDAASRLIAHYGFDKTTMDDIAHEARVSKGALYLEWPGKDQLFDALINFEMQRVLIDLQRRMQQDPQGGLFSHLYGHTLVALKANPLILALYTRDSRILGDFIYRQDTRRYTERLLLGKDVVAGMQAAGMLRPELRPEVMVYLFSIVALGFAAIGSLIPPEETPPLEDVVNGVSAMVENGLCLPGQDSQVGKDAMMRMVELLIQQYDGR